MVYDRLTNWNSRPSHSHRAKRKSNKSNGNCLPWCCLLPAYTSQEAAFNFTLAPQEPHRFCPSNLSERKSDHITPCLKPLQSFLLPLGRSPNFMWLTRSVWFQLLRVKCASPPNLLRGSHLSLHLPFSQLTSTSDLAERLFFREVCSEPYMRSLSLET